MLTFSNYLLENIRYNTLEEIKSAISAYKKAGEIANPEYQNLKNRAQRVFGEDARKVEDLTLKIIHGGDKSQEVSDLYWTLPHDSFQGLKKFQKQLDKSAKNSDSNVKQIVEAGRQLLSRWAPIAEDIAFLKDKVVKITAKREQAKAVKTKELENKFNDSVPLIKILESHLKEYKEATAKRAEEFIQEKLKILQNADWDLNKVAPRPKSHYGGRTYKEDAAKRALYQTITKAKNEYVSSDKEDIRIVNQEGVKRYIDLSVKGAEESYRQFMQKMINKIGKPVIDAVMTGNIWTNASLKVTTSDGETQVWNTKMIVNFSKYQTMFNQFPTRRAK